MSQTPNPEAYTLWNNKPSFMMGVQYTGNQWEQIHAWLDAGLRAARVDEREKAVERIQTLHVTREYDVDDVCCWTLDEHNAWLKAITAVRDAVVTEDQEANA